MINISLDIETIPSQLESVRTEYQKQIDDALFSLEPPASYSKAKQEEWLVKKSEELLVPLDQYEPYRKLSFDGALNHIISIGVCHNGERKHFTVEGDAIEGERTVLKDFFSFVQDLKKGGYVDVIRWIGHNITGFDLKIIRHRSMILGIKPPVSIPFSAKPWDENPYDTMAQWDARNFVSLDKLAKAFGLSGKGDVDGSKVYDMYLNGQFKEIGEYCADDAELAYKIYQRMTFQENE